MEAVPKLPMISFELKVSPEPTHFGPKLKQYIAEAYREDPDSYGNEIHQLESLRSTAVRPSVDTSGLNTLIRYFCQLRAMQSRFPMSKHHPAAVNFSWKDLYPSNMTVALPDIRYEMACIMYNIGAMFTQLAVAEPRTSPESLKTACTYFQNAAWAFMYLREHYPQPPGYDVCTDIAKLLQEICFAQAQECILDKSIQDTRKPSVVGAVATQVQNFYRNALAILGPSTGSDNIHEIIGHKQYNHWYRYLSFKMSYIGCIVCLYQGLNAEEQQKFGERLAFYQLAVEKLYQASKLAKYIEPVQVTQEALTFTNDVVEGKRKAARNENEFIYHEEVPDKDLLVDLKPVSLVKPLAINLNDPAVMGHDIFSRLVPIGAHEASSVYSEEKAKLLRGAVSQAEEKNSELMEFMSSLQLDQLDLLDADQKIPQEIVDRCAAMNAKADIIQTLVDSMNSLAEIISDVEHTLSEIKTLIQDEFQKEKEYQKIMGKRPPSIVQTELAREFHKYQEAHTRTNESNQVLHKAMTLHIANLRLLAQPLDVLQSKIPSIDNIEGLDRETMVEMRRVVAKAREMRSQRDLLIQQLRDAITSDDITATLLARSTEPPEEIFKQELEKHTPKIKIIEQNLAAQENIINKLTSLYASYGESRRLLSDVIRKREGLINALITSYDSYEELLTKSQKGLEFYKKLSVNVNQLLTRIKGTCQVQEEERAQLLAKQVNKAPTPVPATSAAVKLSESTPAMTSGTTGGGNKLKDYLPYMKNRGAARSVTPQAVVDPVPPDNYYPESIYPTSVRPAPVGSEATDPAQMKLPDGVVVPTGQNIQSPYNRFGTPYSTETDPYSSYAYPATSKTYEKPNDPTNYGYSTPYTPPQFSTNMSDSQYANPYYSGTNNNPTIVTDSQNIAYNTNQPNVSANQYVYDPYGAQTQQITQNQGVGQEHATGMSYNQGVQMNTTDLSNNFSQMQLNNQMPKSEALQVGYNGEYNPAYYSVNCPQVPTTNMATYSSAPQNSNTNMVPSQVPSDYNTLQYPYSTEAQNGFAQIATQVSLPNTYGVPNQPVYDAAGTTCQTSQPSTSQPYSLQQTQVSQAYSLPEAYSDSGSFDPGYMTYMNSENATTSTTNIFSVPVTTPMSSQQPYSFNASDYPNAAALAQLDAMDQPIKSHVTGEALTTNLSFTQNYNHPTTNFATSTDQIVTNYNKNVPDQSFANNQQNYQVTVTYANQPDTYVQNVQNHPGYTFNNATGTYEYTYGSQNSFTNYQPSEQPDQTQCQNWPAHGVYTSAGNCETVQSPSEIPQSMPQDQTNNQIYYNTPYGYITNTNQANNMTPDNSTVTTNYGANVNQSTYMQSGQQDTSVTYTENQVSSPKENVNEPPNFSQGAEIPNQSTEVSNQVTVEVSNQVTAEVSNQVTVEVKTEPIENAQSTVNEPPNTTIESTEPTAFDLLADIDFTVEQKPLMPEIKVPQISESAIVKPAPAKVYPVPKPVIKEEVIERPAKRDIFTDPSLLNKFTQEVKNLQKLTDSLTNKASGGLTVLDAKWKQFQDSQTKENMTRSTAIAMKHCSGNVLTEVVPYDDSRLTLKSDSDVYLNASYYKQLAAWCIPLVISKNPSIKEYNVFWKMILENKISSIVCLLSEIELQGKTYWPTAIGQCLELTEVKVILEEVSCNVHWTERRLTVTCGKIVGTVFHYQITVFPAKIVCSPLVLLADKILSQTYDNRLSNQLTGALIHCGTGAGRSAVVALLVMAMCQVRAGQIELCDMLDSGCVNLYKHRTNVLEDTKFLADAYRTVLFYVQGVLCSGTTMFNGEAVSVSCGAAAPPPAAPALTPSPANTATSPTNTSIAKNKFSRESFEEMKQSPGLTSGDMKDPLNFLDPLWSLKKK